MNTLLGCCLIHLCIGSVYALSVLYPAILAKTGWEDIILIKGFSFTILTLGLTAALHQYVLKDCWKLIVLCFGTLMWCFSNLVIFSNIVIEHNSIPIHYIGSLLLGLSIGLLYVVPINIVSELKFSMKGLASGSVVGCFGLGSILSAKIFSNVTDISTPLIFGFIIACTSLLCLGIYFIEDLGECDSLNPPEEFERDRKWYLLAVTFTLNIGIGISLLSNLTSFGLINGLNLTETVELVALAGLLNTLGRFIYPIISDFIGKFLILGVMFSLQLLAVLTVYVGEYWEIGVLIILSIYGGMFAILPSLLNKLYNNTIAYSQMLSVWGIAGMIFPILFNYFNLYLLIFLCGMQITVYLDLCLLKLKTCGKCI